jgi:hypothetical protein
VVPDTVGVNVTAVVVALAHNVCVVGESVTAGVGLTIIVSFLEIPVQLFTVGVTVIIAVTGEIPVFVAVNELMLLVVPLAAKPIEVVLLFHT